MTTAANWYTLAQLAEATGLPERTLRDFLDKDRISYVQWEHNEKRRLTDDTVVDLEALGIPVNREVLNRGRNGRNGKSETAAVTPGQ